MMEKIRMILIEMIDMMIVNWKEIVVFVEFRVMNMM